MKNVIIITREGEYPKNCEVFRQSQSQWVHISDNSQIYKYLKEYIKTRFNNIEKTEEAKKNWDPLTRGQGKLPGSDEINKGAIATEWGNESCYMDFVPWVWNNKIEPIIDKCLNIGCESDEAVSPYFRIEQADAKIYFVFLNRIFDSFVESSSEYSVLVSDDRKGFIKAICQDCGALDENGNAKSGYKNILYIHDKEWYREGNDYCALYDGEWKLEYAGDAGADASDLAKWFSIIQVFKHSTRTFEKIKSLNFCFAEEEEEKRILEKGFFKS